MSAKKFSSREDEEIVCALVEQVTKAAAGGSERDVVTFITLPLWNAFLRALGEEENQDPRSDLRVYGSKTVLVVGVPSLWSASRKK